ncbi:amino acid-binding protein [Brachybacterium endophyticum]|uniref:Amino acid-binding protein n=1 Tax=Brachybacterium endophyticum TaxID=2182385 RepID=A0A2U2RI13_9MICO|nr:ABC transporter substrate-binding protein [Brachybacterium endophyticum]PWH05471.1 amino acid-binding protein [Brachybacterium endophyticum]
MTPARSASRSPRGHLQPPGRVLTRRGMLAGAASLPALAALAACADPTTVSSASGTSGVSDSGGSSDGGSSPIDTSGKQKRIRTKVDEELAKAVPETFRKDGKLTVATTVVGGPPLCFMADDNKTPIGSEPDIAQLAADKLGLELDLKITSWENWPLKLKTGEFEVVHSNVGINDERLHTFDFASYRRAFMTFLVKKGAKLGLGEPDSVSGRIIAVGNGTNQEALLMRWNEDLKKDGKDPAELKNFSSDADVLLALGSGRVDAYFAPFETMNYVASTRDDVETQGKIDELSPGKTLVAATFKRGTGIAEVYAKALQATIDEGTYAKVLDRWGLGSEAVKTSRAHTKENP